VALRHSSSYWNIFYPALVLGGVFTTGLAVGAVRQGSLAWIGGAATVGFLGTYMPLMWFLGDANGELGSGRKYILALVLAVPLLVVFFSWIARCGQWTASRIARGADGTTNPA